MILYRYMSDFEKAFSYMIRNEDYNLSGKITPEPNGGKARLGINSVANPQAVSDGFYEMPLNDAIAYVKTYYQKNYWAPHGFDAVNNQQVATKLFDIAVNMGNGGEHLEVVAAVELALGHSSANLLEDINAIDPTILLKDIIAVITQKYKNIAAANPAKYPKGVPAGWLVRAAKLPLAV